MKPGDVPGLTAGEIMGFSHYLEPMSQIHGDLDIFTGFSHIFWKKPYKIPEPLTFSQRGQQIKRTGRNVQAGTASQTDRRTACQVEDRTACQAGSQCKRDILSH